jgi:hypothetical protein
MRHTRTVMTLGILITMTLGLSGCNREPDYSEMPDSGKRRVCYWRILDGLGGESLGPNGEDSFTLLQEMLFHPDRDTRSYTVSYLKLSIVGAGKVHKYSLDGYIDAGRDAELQAALYRAWQQEKGVEVPSVDHTRAHTRIAKAYLDLRRRQHLHRHPELAAEMSVGRNLPLAWASESKTWGGFTREDHEFLDDRLIESGDEEYLQVLAYYREYYTREQSP